MVFSVNDSYRRLAISSISYESSLVVYSEPAYFTLKMQNEKIRPILQLNMFIDWVGLCYNALLLSLDILVEHFVFDGSVGICV